MKQRLRLYIGNILADTGEDALILFNYTAEELTNPAVVKNSYSQQLKLAGTKNNGRIFQQYWRADAAPGAEFNPSKRVPFQIFADGGIILESGYAKLDKVTRKGTETTYNVTLYGGLGGFLYSLQYDDEKVRTLADLLYSDGAGNAVTLDFTINRATVAEAWQNAYTENSKWSILNFAPAYNGIPEKFDAGRALVKAAKYGLDTSAEGGAYTDRNGYASVDLPGDMTEWQVKDLRSYLQRPVISVRALIRAICDPANNGGYTVELDDAFFADTNSHWYSTWMTLKMLTKLSRTVVSEMVNAGHQTWATEFPGFYRVMLDAGEKIFTVRARPSTYHYDNTNVGRYNTRLYWAASTGTSSRICNGIMLQAVAQDSNGNAVAGSKVVACTADNISFGWRTAAEFAAACGFTPVWDDGSGDDLYGAISYGHFNISDRAAGLAEWSGALQELTIQTTTPVDRVLVFASKVQYKQLSSGDIPWNTLFLNDEYVSSGVNVISSYHENELEYTFTANAEVRSNTPITQEMLLANTMSPAEFLLSYCKRYGLQLRIEKDRKVVHIERRGTTYEDQTVMDVSDRVARDRGVTVTPVSYSVQKFQLSEDGIGAGYEDEYKTRYGVEYGAKRLNTGYEFNASVKKLLDSVKFKTAPEVKLRDLCFLTVTDPGQTPATYPAVFLNSGLKYHLFAANNRDTNDLVVPSLPASIVYDYWDANYHTYDAVPRLQLCDKDNKAKDGDGVLVFYQGRKELPAGFYLSDDLDEMYLGNNENPCWVLEAADAFAPAGESADLLAPCFGRFRYGDSRHTRIVEMLEFGTPQELAIPGATVLEGIDIFSLFWRRYMGDRYSEATKVMECYVNLNGLGVPARELLRHFFYIDGALWVLNKVSSMNLNSVDPVKCEFVQVQSVYNYQ